MRSQKRIADFQEDNKNMVSSTSDVADAIGLETESSMATSAKKLIYNVVWRDASNKKYKSWQGDGVLEVDLSEKRVYLKDVAGKNMGSAKTSETYDSIREGLQLLVGGKEIEILEEVKDTSTSGATTKLSVVKDRREPQDNLIKPTLNGKIIFKVVWREISNKKNKTWQGDGTLEVQPHEKSAALKDDKGSYMGTAALNANAMKEGMQLIVGGKEIELLEEIKSADEYWSLRRQQAESRGWGDEEYEEKEAPEGKRRKGSFFFHPYLTNLDSVKPRNTKGHLNTKNVQYMRKKHEYICFVRPSELQFSILNKALDFYNEQQEIVLKDLTSVQIITVLRQLCNHPSLIGRSISPNVLSRNLERHLPDWSDMGPFDSTKLEFVQHFLAEVVMEKREKCVLVSNDEKTLNMLHGLCDHLHLKCLRLDRPIATTEYQENVEQFNTFGTGDEAPLVCLLSAEAVSGKLNLIGASRLIFYDSDWNLSTDDLVISLIWRTGQPRDVQIYRLVTSGSIEEKILQHSLAKVELNELETQSSIIDDYMKVSATNFSNLFSLQQEFDFCQTHESLQCNCEGNGENLAQKVLTEESKQVNELMCWKHYQPPFNETFLKEAGLTNVTDNIIYVFAKQTDFA